MYRKHTYLNDCPVSARS